MESIASVRACANVVPLASRSELPSPPAPSAPQRGGAPIAKPSAPTPPARTHGLERQSLVESRVRAPRLVTMPLTAHPGNALRDIWPLLADRHVRSGHMLLAETIVAALASEDRLPHDALAWASDPLFRYLLLVDVLGLVEQRKMGERAAAVVQRELRAMLASQGRRLRASIDAAVRASHDVSGCDDEPADNASLDADATALDLLRRALAHPATDRTLELLGQWQAVCGWRMRQTLRAPCNELQWVQLAQTLRALRELAVARSFIAAGEHMLRRSRQLRAPLKRTRLQLAVTLLESIEMPPSAEQLLEMVDEWLLDARFSGGVFAAWVDTLRFEICPERWPSDEDRAEFIALLARLAYRDERIGG
jgi:hypothetical protein